MKALRSTVALILMLVSATAWAVKPLVGAPLPDMVGDTGAGGARGAVPAPAAGDAARGAVLGADGTWSEPDGAPWIYGTCTRISDATFSVVDNAANVAIFRPGIPMRYGDVVGTWRYGLITTVVDAGATLTVTITGAAMTAAFDGYCQYGDASLVDMVPWSFPGQFADVPADPTLILNDLLHIVPPNPATTRYLVQTCIRPITDDSGANQPACMPYIAGVAASTALTIDDTAWVCSSTATVDAAQYDQLNGEAFEFGCDAGGSNDDAVNLSVQMTWIRGE
uniref:Uncharacterized protein n=1 Tax=viral metagenome TaxID=1070528 RepID=A0A6M3JA97_9ZZZZ